MNPIARLSLVGLALATTSAPAWAQAVDAPATEATELSTHDELAARNTARDYLVANYMETLRAKHIDVYSLHTSVATTDIGDIIVHLFAPGLISAAILMSAEEFEVLQASVSFPSR
jgi:hypothetical protein